MRIGTTLAIPTYGTPPRSVGQCGVRQSACLDARAVPAARLGYPIASEPALVRVGTGASLVTPWGCPHPSDRGRQRVEHGPAPLASRVRGGIVATSRRSRQIRD